MMTLNLFRTSFALGLILLQPVCQAWPDKPPQILVGSPAGGQADVLARALAAAMASELGQSLVVVNRDGAGGTIATGAVSRSEPDGYTLSFGPAGPLVLQPLIKKVPYDPADVVGVCQTFVGDIALVASNKSKFKDAREVIAAAKAKPGALAYGVGGMGTILHLAAVELTLNAGVKMTAVPYRGDPPLALAIRAGETELGVMSVGTAQTQGLRILGVFSPSRLATAPDAPTMTEQGFPVVTQLFGGLYAPKALPSSILGPLQKACEKATKSDNYLAAAKGSQQWVVYKNSQDFTKAIAAERETMGKAVKAANMKFED